MRNEWLGVVLALGLGATFAACEDDSETTTSSGSSTNTSTATGQAGSDPQGGGGSGAAGAQGGDGGIGGIGNVGGSGGQAPGGNNQGGQGGGPNCGAVPLPVGNLGICGGSAASNGSGGLYCEIDCDDQASNTYSVECDLGAGACECKVNNVVYCICNGSNGCSNHCCPAPWDDVAFGGVGGGGAGGAGTSVTVTGPSTATTGP
jgi:hypothetical protein